MFPLLIALCIAVPQDKSVADWVEAFLKKDAEAEKKLVDLAPYAVIPVSKVRDQDPQRVKQLLAKLRTADVPAPIVALLTKKVTFHTNGFIGDVPGRDYKGIWGIPVYMDRLPKDVNPKLTFEETPLIDILDAIAVAIGLEVAIRHNHIVYSTPDRLWATEEPPRARVLTADEAAQAKKWIEVLGAEMLDERAAAELSLLKLGPAVLPLVEEGIQHADKEVASRCRSLVARLRTPPRVGVFGPTGAARQKLDNANRAVLATLETTPINFRVTKIQFHGFLMLSIKQRGVDFTMAEDLKKVPITATFTNCVIHDLLALLCQGMDADFVIRAGRVHVDTRAEIDKEVGSK